LIAHILVGAGRKKMKRRAGSEEKKLEEKI
jgi:hypothetical protein